MPINVSEALDLDTGEIVVYERTPGGYVDGIYQKGTPVLDKSLMSVQQPTPQELQLLPEGQRVKDVRKFISKKPLYSAESSPSQVADIVHYKSKKYRIISPADWDVYGHTTALGARI